MKKIALLLAICFVFTSLPCQNALAEKNYYGDVSITGDINESVYVFGSDTSVVIDGNITTPENSIAINAAGGSAIDVTGEVNGGDITIYGENTTVTVGGGTISSANISGQDSSLSGITNIEADKAIVALNIIGRGTAEITGDIVSNGSGSFTVIQENGEPRTFHPSNKAIFASSEATVTVGGDVSVGEGYSDTNVTEDGQTYSSYSTNSAVDVFSNSRVIVGGDVIASERDTSINAYENSTVNVGGNAIDGSIYAYSGSEINVAGEANVSSINVYGDGSHVTVGGGVVSHISVSGENAYLSGVNSVEPKSEDENQRGISVHNGGTAEISGDVIGGSGNYDTLVNDFNGERIDYYQSSTAISATNNAVVTVGGNVTAGDGFAETVTFEDGHSTTSYHSSTAIFAEDNSTVSIGGNVTTADDDIAVNANSGSIIDVEGEINGGIIYVNGDNTHVTSNGGTITYAQVFGEGASLEGIDNIHSKETVALTVHEGGMAEINGDVINEGGGAVQAWGNVTVNIGGNVASGGTEHTITLEDGSTQTIYLSGPAISAADNAMVRVGGNVTGTDDAFSAVYSEGGATVIIEGNVEGGVSADSKIYKPSTEESEQSNPEGGTVIVEGTINSFSGLAVLADNGSTVIVNDDVLSEKTAIKADGESNVTVNGDITAGYLGISAFNDSTVTITGNIESDSMGIAGVMGASITVNGMIDSGDTAITTDNISTTDIHGNIKSDAVGIEIFLEKPEEEIGTVIVNGVVDAKNKAIEVCLSSEVEADDVINAMPHIIVQTLESDGDLVVVTAPDATLAEKRALQDALLDNIYYIVNTENLDTTKIAIYGTEVVDGYVVATENSTITLQSKQSGYVVCNVEAGKYATVTENPDGSVSVTVERGGDLNISADVKEKNSDKDYEGHGNYINWDDYSSPWSDYGSKYSDLWHEPAINYNDSWGWQGAEVHHTDHNLGPIWQQSYQNKGWDTAYAISPDYNNMVLVINLIGREDLCVLRTDLESFRNIGFETVNIVTEESSMYMTMSNLLELYAGANQCMFVNNGYSVELWVMNTLVFTITMVKDEKIAA